VKTSDTQLSNGKQMESRDVYFLKYVHLLFACNLMMHQNLSALSLTTVRSLEESIVAEADYGNSLFTLLRLSTNPRR